jgi:hypothetical protein
MLSVRRLPTKHLPLLAGLVIVLNLLDAIWTLSFVEAGVAAEANPLMSNALGHGPLGFMIVKLTLVSLSVLLLWRLRHRTFAAFGLWSGALAYSLVLAYHLSNAHHLALAAG